MWHRITTKKVKLHTGDKELTEVKQVNYTSFIYVVINAIKDFYYKWFIDSSNIHKELSILKIENRELRYENESIKNYLCIKDPAAVFCK